MGVLRKLLRVVQVLVLLAFVLPLGVALFVMWRGEPLPKASVLHVRIDGPLAEEAQPSVTSVLRGRGHATLLAVTAAMRRAADDPRILGMLLDVRGGGVGAAQLAELCDAAAAFRRSKKWTAAYLESAGELGHGDAALALAASAGPITLSPPGEVGLSGLRAEVPFVRDLLTRAHVTATTEQRYEYKNFANTFTEDGFTAPHREALAGVLDDVQATLLGIIANARGVPAATVRGWAAASPYDAEAARAARLVDRVGYWDEMLTDVEHVAGRPDALLGVERYARAAAPQRTAPVVAVVVIAGQIVAGEGGPGNAGGATVGADDIGTALRDARRDGVRGVLLRIDSPGGSALASDLIRREVQLTREAGIPVVVSMGDTAASGGYYVAVDADHIVAQPGTITGSIGVVAASFGLRRALADFFGVHFDAYAALPQGPQLSWLDPPSAADRVRLGRSVDRVYDDFVAKVAHGRHLPLTRVQGVARGRIWSGRQAVELGLADELGGIDTALQALRSRAHLDADAALRLTAYPAPDNWAALLRAVADNQARLPRIAALAPLWRTLARVGASFDEQALLAPL